METMKNEVELRLVGSLLSDCCKQRAEKKEGFIYCSGFDSTYRIIRFTTPVLQSLFNLSGHQKGYWGNGHAAMYEICNSAVGVTITCVTSSVGLSKKESMRMRALASACGAHENAATYKLIQWSLSDGAEYANSLTERLEQILECELSWFENELSIWKENPNHTLRAFPRVDYLLVSNKDLPDEIYMEGAQKTILVNQYERNPKARARCIAVHGAACKVCGFDFGTAFGEAFSGKIEVHHIKPISEIGEEYVVDPARDLVPVCPNCHMMLHSKKNGVFTIEELKALLKN